VENRLFCRVRIRIVRNGIAGVGVGVEPRCVAAGDLDAHLMSGQKCMPDVVEFDLIMFGLPGRKQFGVVTSAAIARSDDSDRVGAQCKSPSIPIHIQEFRSEVSITCIAGGKNVDEDLSDDFERLVQQIACVDQHIVPNGPLPPWAQYEPGAAGVRVRRATALCRGRRTQRRMSGRGFLRVDKYLALWPAQCAGSVPLSENLEGNLYGSHSSQRPVSGPSRKLGPTITSGLPTIRELPRLAVLELIPMLFQDDTHQLTARTDPGLGKELLKCGFDRALRHSDSRCNLFVRKTLEHAGKHVLFSFRE